MKIYLLIPDYDYEGYGAPKGAWDHKPSKEEIMSAFMTRYYPDIALGKEPTKLEDKYIEMYGFAAAELADTGSTRHWELFEMDLS